MTYNIVVHSNDMAYRKRGRLGMDIVLFKLGLTHCTRTFHGVVWPIKIILKKYFKKFYGSKKLTPEELNRKRQTLLTGTFGKWNLIDMNKTKPPIKRPRLTQRRKKRVRKSSKNFK